MEKKLFRTLVKFNHKFGGETYVKGRISGIQYMVCEDESPGYRLDIGDIIQTTCTKEQYDKFAEIVEDFYPGLCEFYYEGSK